MLAGGEPCEHSVKKDGWSCCLSSPKLKGHEPGAKQRSARSEAHTLILAPKGQSEQSS